jgi:SlyX protein
MTNNSMKDALESLEIKLAYQEDTIEMLNLTIIQQQDKINKIEEVLRKMADKIKSMPSSEWHINEQVELPPHY